VAKWADSSQNNLMTEYIENPILEHLKNIQAEQAAARERDADSLVRLSSIESGLARIARDGSATYSEVIHDRHAADKLRERIERIENHLEPIG
jgi:hypothetical protein